MLEPLAAWPAIRNNHIRRSVLQTKTSSGVLVCFYFCLQGGLKLLDFSFGISASDIATFGEADGGSVSRGLVVPSLLRQQIDLHLRSSLRLS